MYKCNYIHLLLFSVVFIAGMNTSGHAQTFFGLSSSSNDNTSQAGPSVTVAPPASMQAGDLVVVYVQYRGTGVTITNSNNGGQTWNTGSTTNSGTNHSLAVLWCRFNGTWSASPSFTVTTGTGAMTAVMYVYRPNNSLSLWGVHVNQNNQVLNNANQTVNSYNTTVPRTVSMAFVGNSSSNTWSFSGTGWTLPALPVAANQIRNTASGTLSYSAAYNIQTSAATINSVTFTQGSSVSTGRTYITWFELTNDECANSILLTSGTSCTNTPGSMFGSTISSPTINAPNCASGVTYDVWYRFVAQTTNPTISLSGVAFPNPGIQILSNNCGGTFTSFFCGTTSVTTNHLTPGTTYFIRVFSTGAAPVSQAAGAFNICVTDPVTPPPANDDCANAANLSVAQGCSNINGDMAGATASSPALGGLCTGPLAYDVWYRFIAPNVTATVNIGGLGANFLNPGIEVFSGSCGSLTSIACGTGTSLTMTGILTAGTTYYIRIYSRSTPAPNGNARFTICVTSPLLPVMRFGNSYVNVSKRNTGGVVQPGDTLEIRMMMNLSATATFNNPRFVDNIPSNTAMLTGPTDRIRIITNEGLPYKEYTLAGADDPATYLASPPPGQFNVRVNLGFGSSNPGIPTDNSLIESVSASGTVANTNRPRGGGGLLFAVAYRVVVTGGVGDTITINPAQVLYRSGVTDVTLTANSYQILISDPLSLCNNSTGLNNAVESGGTFGSGTTLNRPNDLTTPIPGYNFVNNINAYNNLGDGRYAIVKNISPRSGTSRNSQRVTDPATPLAYDDQLNRNNRMFNGHWYPDGDHSGTNNAIGNVPPGPTTNSGYMLMVNADYIPSDVYKQTLTNLCPSTYYEFSAWVRNICPTCGVDSIGQQFAGTPTAPTNGYPGVYPNLSFSVDGIDYYNTGQIDTVGWVKRGFVFLTGPSQTSATLSIRNNAQGGGGNDFVIDDIGVATCLPGLTMRPNNTPTYCRNGSINLSVAVSSFYSNYQYYQWERSTDGGATWHSAPERPGIQTFSYTNFGSDFRDTVSVPTFIANSSMNGYMYRVRIATITSNLTNDNCSIYNSTDVITITVNPGCDVLPAELLSFNVQPNNGYAKLRWESRNEADQLLSYEIEKSTDGVNFKQIGIVTATGGTNAAYLFHDPEAITGKIYYRLKLVSKNEIKYSRIISLAANISKMDITNLVNPFNSKISFQLNSLLNEDVQLQLTDAVGNAVVSKKITVLKGNNLVNFEVPSSLAKGSYLLRVLSVSGSVHRIIQKL